jgi:hypothetical protein
LGSRNNLVQTGSLSWHPEMHSFVLPCVSPLYNLLVLDGDSYGRVKDVGVPSASVQRRATEPGRVVVGGRRLLNRVIEQREALSVHSTLFDHCHRP